MLLVDSGLWTDHLRRADPELQRELDAGTLVGRRLASGPEMAAVRMRKDLGGEAKRLIACRRFD